MHMEEGVRKSEMLNRNLPPTEVVVAAARAEAAEEKSIACEDKHKAFNHMSDRDLIAQIQRNKQLLKTLGSKLPDNGDKLRATIHFFEHEIHRRKRQQSDKKDDGCEKPTEFHNPSLVGAYNGSKQGDPPSSQSAFASHLYRNLEDKMDSVAVNAFEKELSYIKSCDGRKARPNGQFSSRGRHKNALSWRQKPFHCPSSLSIGADNQNLANSDKKCRGSSTCSVHRSEENSSGRLSKKRNVSQGQLSNNLRHRNGQTVVLLDEEEPQLIETTEQAGTIDERMKEAKIYYPSRDDPESVVIYYSDMECLSPAAYLSSTIMNFYIRYLQQPSSTNRTGCSYHFFNTYFYEKLKEAVLKKNEKENSFERFRRWWKGVNIFKKAYILLPIHDNLHWSLVIICIPYKEDEAGPTLLHLDSLGLHASKSIFRNVKSFLREEWNYLNRGEARSDLPIAHKIWQNLPDRIYEKIIAVPQQRNEYDCGVFVLFFMERFIQEAPERLKKKDIAMFGKHWFGHEEPSCLRRKIKNILMEEFNNASEQYLDS